MTLNPIFQFKDPEQFLRAVWTQRQEVQPTSLRAWSRELGYRNPSLVSETLLGKRGMNDGLAQALAEHLNLPKKEAEYLRGLVKLKKSKDETDRQLIEWQLQKLNPLIETNSLAAEQFALIADWYHLALLFLCDLEPLPKDSILIARKLRNKVSPRQVETGLERLQALDLLVYREETWQRTTSGPFVANFQVPSSAVREFHRQMIQLGTESIEEQSVAERVLGASTLSFSTEVLGEAHQIILECHERLQHLSQASGSTTQERRLLQFNTQMFFLDAVEVSS